MVTPTPVPRTLRGLWWRTARDFARFTWVCLRTGVWYALSRAACWLQGEDFDPIRDEFRERVTSYVADKIAQERAHARAQHLPQDAPPLH